jgi:hypothetical protein
MKPSKVLEADLAHFYRRPPGHEEHSKYLKDCMTRQVRLAQEARNRTLTEAGFKGAGGADAAPGTEGGKKTKKNKNKNKNKNKEEGEAAPAPGTKPQPKGKGKAKAKGKGKAKAKAKAEGKPSRAKSEEPGGKGPNPKEYCWYHNCEEGGCNKKAKDCQFKHEMLPVNLRDKIPKPRGGSAGPKGSHGVRLILLQPGVRSLRTNAPSRICRRSW